MYDLQRLEGGYTTNYGAFKLLDVMLKDVLWMWL